jgi:hypothetical protein
VALAAFTIGGTAAAASPSGESPAPPADAKQIRPKTLLMTANEVVARALPRLLERPADTAQRISVRDGLLGLGGYDAPGGSGFGWKAPPLQLFPRAGAGNSLNVDPVTGRLR